MSTNEEYGVWAILYETRSRTGSLDVYSVGVSAESEYGAVKRLVGNRHCAIRKVVRTNLKPEYEERRIEGFARVQDIDWSDVPTWEYT